MARPKRLQPWLKQESNGVWYIYFHQNGRAIRRTCGTRERTVAEAFYTAFVAPAEDRPTRELRCRLAAREPWRSMARRMCKRARENAKAKGRLYSLNPDAVLALLEQQQHRCAVTGMPLRLPVTARDPWAPSIDQILPGRGYTPDNIRVVCVLINTAMNQWGEAPLLELIHGWARRKEAESPPLFLQ